MCRGSKRNSYHAQTWRKHLAEAALRPFDIRAPEFFIFTLDKGCPSVTVASRLVDPTITASWKYWGSACLVWDRLRLVPAACVSLVGLCTCRDSCAYLPSLCGSGTRLLLLSLALNELGSPNSCQVSLSKASTLPALYLRRGVIMQPELAWPRTIWRSDWHLQRFAYLWRLNAGIKGVCDRPWLYQNPLNLD